MRRLFTDCLHTTRRSVVRASVIKPTQVSVSATTVVEGKRMSRYYRLLTATVCPVTQRVIQRNTEQTGHRSASTLWLFFSVTQGYMNRITTAGLLHVHRRGPKSQGYKSVFGYSVPIAITQTNYNVCTILSGPVTD